MVLDGDIRILTQGIYLSIKAIINNERKRKLRALISRIYPTMKVITPQLRIIRIRMIRNILEPLVLGKLSLKTIMPRKLRKWVRSQVP
jgi:hypothetical protein